MNDKEQIRPFQVDVPEAVLDDLRDRLDRTRWTDELPTDPGDESGSGGILPSGWRCGLPLHWLRGLVAHWRTAYDWRVLEARLNAYPQFLTEIDGQRVHFLHVRSGEPGALPIILTHGWPGSIVEYLDVIGPLTDPRAHGGDPRDAFDLVIPSIPGFGFSGPTTEPGWHRYRIAAAWVALMRRLGYDRYVAAGNDAGSMISPEVGRLAPDRVAGVHVTQVFSFPTGEPSELADLTAEEEAGMARLRWFWETLGSFNQVQSQQPQTLAHALADSPAGLLAWSAQLFDADLDADFVLDNVMTYWVTGTAGSSIRLYFEDAHTTPPTGQTVVPLGLAMAGGDFVSIRRFAERDHKNIVSWHAYERGSHWQAHREPAQLVADIREFCRPLR